MCDLLVNTTQERVKARLNVTGDVILWFEKSLVLMKVVDMG